MVPLDDRFDRIDRNMLGIETALQQLKLQGREVREFSSELVQKQAFCNLLVISIIFSFTVLACICVPEMVSFCVTLGIVGCLYTGHLINNMSREMFHGQGLR